MNALEYLKTHLKYEKNPRLKEGITQKFTDYLRRVEEIRDVLEALCAQSVQIPNKK
ncbi:putative vesicle-fusing ATPase [Helianthus anomalus]